MDRRTTVSRVLYTIAKPLLPLLRLTFPDPGFDHATDRPGRRGRHGSPKQNTRELGHPRYRPNLNSQSGPGSGEANEKWAASPGSQRSEQDDVTPEVSSVVRKRSRNSCNSTAELA